LWEGIFGEGEIFKLSNFTPSPYPSPIEREDGDLNILLPLREREVILTLRNTCY